jgi:hypothetical protein
VARRSWRLDYDEVSQDGYSRHVLHCGGHVASVQLDLYGFAQWNVLFGRVQCALASRLYLAGLGGGACQPSTVSDSLDLDMGITLFTDGHDGTHTLDFVTQPLVQDDRGATKPDTAVNVGILTIPVYYDFTCSIGSLLAPQKERYARAREVQISWSHTSIPRPYIRSFDVPNIDRVMDLSRYDKVYGFGDSLMMQLVKWYKADLYWHPKLVYLHNVNQALSDANETQSMLAKLREYHGAHLQSHSHHIYTLGPSLQGIRASLPPTLTYTLVKIISFYTFNTQIKPKSAFNHSS